METRSHLDVLLDLDARHDQLLQQLAELDARINTVLSQYSRGKATPLTSGPEHVLADRVAKSAL